MKLNKIIFTSLMGVTLSFSCNCDNTLNGDFKLQCSDFGIILGDNHKSACCNVAVDYSFHIKDKGRNDNNISTKKIGDIVNLTINSDMDFSGKIYSVIQESDKNISDINISSWNDESEKNITIDNISKISKKAYIYIKWDDNTTNDNNGEQNSTDKFAIIPMKYIFNVPSQIKAGESYSIEINATDNNDINQSYNQTLDRSSDTNSTIVYKNKDDYSVLNLSFKNGVVDRKDFNISDIGDYRLELNDTNFASIDKDDTAEKDRTIYGGVDIKVIPYKFRINLKSHKTSTGQKWLYQGQEFNYSLEANITALNKNDEVLKHFDKDEYSTDVNTSLKFILTKYDNNDVNLSYIKSENTIKTDTQMKIKNGTYEITYNIKDNNFTKGVSTNFGIVTYIKKDISNYNSPVDLNITEVNTTSKTAQNNGVYPNDDISYYYPKLNTEDIFTTYKETNTTVNILVYDENTTDSDVRFDKKNEVLVNWYKNVDDDISDIDNYQMNKSSKMDSDKITIGLSKSSSNGGIIDIKVDNNTTPKTNYGVIHLDTPLYLWYSKYKDPYSYTDDSSCVNHYCIEYNYKSNNSKYYDVGSGSFSGSEVNNTIKINTDRKGMKIYR